MKDRIIPVLALIALMGVLGLIAFMAVSARDNGSLKLERARQQNYDDGFIAGAKAAIRHAHVDGTNVVVDWSDILSEDHGPKH